jgi:predicted transposase YbfD/YdcC
VSLEYTFSRGRAKNSMLDLSGATVTIDAMGYQKDIAKVITEKEADYVLALKLACYFLQD